MLATFFAMAPTATESGAKYISRVGDKRQLLGVSEDLCWRHFVFNLEEDERVHLDIITEVATTMGGPTTGALSWENMVWLAQHLMMN